MTRTIHDAHALGLQGHRAGFVSRVAADAVDLGVVWLIGVSALLSAGVVRFLVAGPPFRPPVLPPWLSTLAGTAICVGYLTAYWATTGRTVGKQLVGLRVVSRSGRRLLLRQALPRAVLYVAFPAGLLWVLVSRSNASVQDLVVRSVVVYDWSYRPAGEPPDAVPTAP